jgi:hypothetical protein
MEVDWLLLGCRAVASWSMRLGSRHRTPLRRSATRTSWDASFTFAKTERPNLASATRQPPAEVSKAPPACAVEAKDSNSHSAVPRVEFLVKVVVEVAGRFMLPTFVARSFPWFSSRDLY